jgi:hypothetical protein
VVTRHAPGRLPTLVEMQTEPALLHELVATLAPADVVRLEPHLVDLWARNDGDLRACLRALYDLYAGR